MAKKKTKNEIKNEMYRAMIEKMSAQLGVEVIQESDNEWQILANEEIVQTLSSLQNVCFALGCIQRGEIRLPKPVEVEVTAPEPAPATEPEEIAIVEPTAIAPTIVTSHLKPQFQVQLDLKKVSKQELKQQVLALLNLQTASQVAKWAKEQGMEVDLCYKSHWAAVLEKAQNSLAVAA